MDKFKGMATETYQITVNSLQALHIGNQVITTEYDPETNKILRKSRTRLQNHYKRSNAYMRSLVRNNNCKDNDLFIKEYFVELKLREEYASRNKLGEILCLEQVFAKKDENQTILLIGDAGYGKTSLCKKIAFDWASDESAGYLNHFYFVAIIDLHELDERTLSDSIMDTIFENVQTEERPDLFDYKINILIMIDGYDEFADNKVIEKLLNEESVEISEKITILITSRPHNVKSITRNMDLRISIEGFTEDKQEIYIRSIFEGQSSCCVNLINHINRNCFLKSIAECPLMLNIICGLYQVEGIGLIKRLTDLYYRMMFQITKDFQVNYETKDLLDTEISKEIIDLLIKLGRKFPYPLNYNNRITEQSLKECLEDEDKFKSIERIQLLYKCPAYYDIIHETFHEFLSALSYTECSDLSPKLSNYALLFLYGLYDNGTLQKIPSTCFQFKTLDYKFIDKLCIESHNTNRKEIIEYVRSLEYVN
ncbi:NACHT, LRR and PYD domains-containing protein 12-like isoform X2 [Centruroides sculpturatus]|uniref:NACHT, LRR and PYD domains-containing protein 12-like isoform X2 n=1 Tax=Centruroides sculpturatus TaxID=218467 RepID=UPI000C6DA352|nr:NACHT, LRR and PYD domains-containing protein 12-like isoform X2 [Centruroides sculpturatus]